MGEANDSKTQAMIGSREVPCRTPKHLMSGFLHMCYPGYRNAIP
jgi:hypothetical protein